ncbi:hypothetical protein [Rhizobium leucaenae]|uniref:hypothetical protein n=1 Tax=Rhizobium leucaenae TaxID=29450 RepID=UPI000AC9E504|nr:hypothetical protein [Rhizobium leucaenae]
MTLFGGRIPNEDGDGYNVSPQPYNELLMIPGYGAQPVPANDNFIADESGASAGFAVGGYIGLARRAGDFMQTFTGGKYWPCDPRPEEVFIEDIAHSLSLQCRYAGHCREFYSVAEHSVHIARWLQRKYGPVMALHGLLHDATEAYVVDVPRPLKPSLANYKEIEERNWQAIAARFGLAKQLPAEVHDADNRIIADELVNMHPMAWHARHADGLGVTIGCWSPKDAEYEFLTTFEALVARRAA